MVFSSTCADGRAPPRLWILDGFARFLRERLSFAGGGQAQRGWDDAGKRGLRLVEFFEQVFQRAAVLLASKQSAALTVCSRCARYALQRSLWYSGEKIGGYQAIKTSPG